jgi:hypothetical protein
LCSAGGALSPRRTAFLSCLKCIRTHSNNNHKHVMVYLKIANSEGEYEISMRFFSHFALKKRMDIASPHKRNTYTAHPAITYPRDNPGFS